MKERPDGYDILQRAQLYLASTYPEACKVESGHDTHGPMFPIRRALRILRACQELSWLGKDEL